MTNLNSFLKRTVDYGVVFHHESGDWVVSGASDADLAGCLTTACSTLGYYARIGQFGTVLSHCGLERKVCTSTGQAETYAVQALIKDVEWLRRMLSELGHEVKDPVSIQVDNAGVVLQGSKTVNHTSAKHYRIAQAFIRQCCDDGIIKLKKCTSEENGADIFTKPLHAPLFLRHQEAILGPQFPPQ